MIRRRSFLAGLGALLAAPALVRASSLEYVPRALILPEYLPFDTDIDPGDVVQTTLTWRTVLLRDGKPVEVDLDETYTLRPEDYGCTFQAVTWAEGFWPT